MKLVSRFAEKYPDLFNFLPAEHIFPHDHLMEKTLLKLIPAGVTPNQITSFRVLGTPFVVFLIIANHYLLGVILFFILALSDAADGSLARTKNQITHFGMMYDPLADKLLIGSMVLFLVFQNFHYLLGIAVLGIEVVFIITALVVKIKFHTVRAANVWGKIKMISQVVAVCITLIALVFNIPYALTVAAWIFGIAIGFAIISLFAHGV